MHKPGFNFKLALNRHLKNPLQVNQVLQSWGENDDIIDVHCHNTKSGPSSKPLMMFSEILRGTSGSTSISVVNLKLPPFWPADPKLWFAQVEVRDKWTGETPILASRVEEDDLGFMFQTFLNDTCRLVRRFRAGRSASS